MSESDGGVYEGQCVLNADMTTLDRVSVTTIVRPPILNGFGSDNPVWHYVKTADAPASTPQLPTITPLFRKYAGGPVIRGVCADGSYVVLQLDGVPEGAEG